MMSSAALPVLLSISLFLVCPVRCSPIQNVVNLKENVGADEFDWRTKGVISPVNNQGQMGNVLTFVLTEGVESLHAIDTKTPVTLLSIQETADCCGDNSFMGQGFNCIVRIGGLCTREGYHAGHGCANNTCTALGKVGSTGYIPSGREDVMMKVIHETPLIVLVDASQASFELYRAGIYSDPQCSKKTLDHAMQLVGYGSENGVDYWILRNSWGIEWGEEGYMRMARGSNMCGLATAAFYPISPSALSVKNEASVKEEVGGVEFDWRTKGVISPVSNEGTMGNVMDFVLTEGVESLHAIVTKTPVTLLSIQEVSDCCKDPRLVQGFDCIVKIGGLCTREGYHAGHGCGNNTCTAVGKVRSTGYIPSGREDEMEKVIHETPLIVLVDASQPSFEIYQSGIYSDPNCSSKNLDHAMQLVGYGSENGVDYWILRNTWGVEWGEEGYIRMVKGKNMCGIATAAFYPIN